MKQNNQTNLTTESNSSFNMKKFYFVAALTALMTLLAPCAWGEDNSWTYSIQSGDAVTNNAITMGDVNWSVNTTKEKGNPTISNTYKSQQCLKFGDGKKSYFSNIVFSTDYFSKYKVKQVEIKIRLETDVETKVVVKQSDIEMGSATYSQSGAWYDMTANTTVGTGGTLSIGITTTHIVYISYIKVTYEAATTQTCTTPTFTISDKTISLSEAESGEYDLTNNLSINKGGSTGAITYSCSNSNVDIFSDSKFQSLYAGTYEVTATMAADATYCEASTTFNITVTAPTVPTYTITKGNHDNGDFTVSATSAEAGTAITLTPTPNSCYQLSRWSVLNKNTTEELTVTNNTFVMPAANVEVTAEFSALPTLATPTNLVVSNITVNSATLTWTAVSNADKYEVTISDKTYTTDKTSYNFTGLTAETEYHVGVKALGDSKAYCDGKQEAQTFQTIAKPKYTITWSSPSGSTTSTVTAGDAVTLPSDPASCSSTYTKFVGWFTTEAGNEGNPSSSKPSEQVTSTTIPTSDVTYYAVFSDVTSGGGLTLATAVESGDVVYLATKAGSGVTGCSSKDATVSSTQSEWMAFTVEGNTSSFKLKNSDGKYVTASGKSFQLTTDGSDLTLESDGRFPTSSTYLQANGTYYRWYTNSSTYTQFYMYKSGTTATGYISSCCSDAAVVTITPANATINLNENGTAATTVTCTQKGGGKGTWSYSVSPSGTATFDGTTFTATAAGTYTVTATYTENCYKSGSATITITKDPVFGSATIDKNTFDVACGDTTSMNSAAIITLGTNYNLTKDISVTAPEGFLVSTNKTDNSKYASSVTLTPTASGENAGKITDKVYVRAYSAIARSNGYSGDITISGTEITTPQKITVSSTVTCQEYELKTNDRGTVTTAGNYYTGATVTAPADPTGVCTDPINYVFDGWSATEVTDGATSYTKVDFSKYTMPKGGATLYAVYKYAADGSSTNTFKKGSLSDLTDGQQVVLLNYTNNVAVSAKTAVDTYNRRAISYTPNNDVITVSETDSVIWTVTKSGSNYVFNLGSNYLGVTESSNKYQLAFNSTKDTWIIATGGTGYTLKSNNNSRYIDYYNSKFTSYQRADDEAFYMHFYVPGTAYSYTSSPACGVYITGTKNIHVTSAKDIWVEAADTFVVSATNLDKNKDGGNVSIEAKVVSGNFKIKTAGTSGDGRSTALPLETDYDDTSYSGKLIVVYTPTEYDKQETGKIALRVYKAGGSENYATDTIEVYGRSLPEQFVIAAKTADGWVALPSDLGTGSSSTVKAPYTITVDDESNPTKATQAPTTALYKGAERNAANTCAKAIRFRSVSNNAYLQASTAANNTGIWLSTTNSNEAQPWKLTSSNFADYNVRVEKSETGRYLGYDATQGKIANYKQTATLRFLPIEVTCTRYDAPTMTSTTAATDKVTLTWAEISGATEYEYSSEQTTWTTIGSVTTVDGVTTAVISGLAATTDYTYYIRVKTTGENCSEVAKVTFTTTDCEDVPNNLSAYASSNSVTISWTANAATSTVKIYSDAAGTTEVVSKTDAKSPCDLMGLKQNTKYYYQVFAGGSCKSAIETFTTETSAISVVEWFQDSLIVNVNTEGSDVSVVIEGQKAHGDAENKNIADGLFFSKYFEANNNVKLLAIYNGTKQDYDLSNYKIYLSVAGASTTSGTVTWDIKINLSDYLSSSDLILKPDSEVILISYQDNNDTDDEILECAKNSSTSGYSRYHRIKSVINFSGNDAVALFNTTTNKFEDMIGAGTASKADLDGVSAKTDFMDAPGWYIKNGTSIEKEDSTIALSTNRCLLIRKNTVKDGLTAVSKNEEDFITFADEWSGKQVPSNSSKEVEIASSCEAFAYVGSFNYNDYYTAYDSIGGLRELNGHQNPDGTYTIPVNRIDTFACKDIRLVVKDNGTEMVNKTQRVPIMVFANTDTKNDTLFHFSADTCKKCDVVVRDNATLTHTSGGRNEFRDMYIYAGSHLKLPADQTFTLQTTHMHAKNDLVSYAIINNDNSTIKINKLVHVKRIDGHYWYPFSLPYDCKISDIVEQCGLDLGTYGTDWGIKYYDGERRQAEATAASLGATGYHWYMMPSTGTLKANKGYIIALALPNENLMRSIYFTPAGTSNYLEDGTEKYSYISNWSDNLTADARHHGWNFVGSPYISLFGEGTDGQGLNNTKMKMGRTNTETGEQEDTKNVYVSVPNGGNTNTYTQSVASGVTLYPFKAYFVQAIDPSTSAPATDSIKLTYTKTNTRLNAPARVQSTAKTIFAELNLVNSDNSLRDNAGVLVGAFTADYEIGSDLTKMYAADVRPQLYTVDAAWGKMAYLAVADEAAHNISLGIYLPAAGSYTLSLNNNLSETGSADAVYLLYNGAVVANLLTMDYTVTATAAGTVNGYSLDIRRASETTTADEWAEGDGPQAHYREGMLYIDNLPSGAEVYVYDVLGRLLLNTVATDAMVSMPTVTTGVYTILVRSNDSQTVLKTLLR